MQHPTPATPDELATVFLRARDIPCPNCNYNRRDSTTAACPECGTDIITAENLPFAAVLGPKRLRIIAFSIASAALVVALFNLGELWQLSNAVVYLPNGPPQASTWRTFGSMMVTLGLGTLGAFVSLCYAARILTESRGSSRLPHQVVRQGHRLNSAILWLAVAVLLPGIRHLLMLAQLIIP